MQLSEQELLRRKSLEELITLGINPYPAEAFEVSAQSISILNDYEKDPRSFEGKTFSIAGRIVSKRVMGSASFALLQDAYGRIQLYLNRDEICNGEDKTLYNTVFKKLLDLKILEPLLLTFSLLNQS